jgi:hypothetical protein
MKRQARLKRSGLGLSALVVATVAAAMFAAGAGAVAPSNTAAPTISGTAREGQALTVSNGSWSNTPASFAYQWQRCNIDGTGCADIAAATNQTYTLAAADVGQRVRATVTASNADGHAAASSDPSEVVSSLAGPTDSTKPTITGTAAIGDELTTHPGSWSAATAFAYQWLRCTPGSSFDCLSVTGATGSTYGVRSADTGKQLRVVVRATNTAGMHAWATSDPTATVTGTTTTTVSTTTTSTVTTTVPGHNAPTIHFLSLKRSGTRVFAQFKVCASRTGQITIIERDNKAKALSYARTFRVTVPACGTFSRNWIPAARFRTHGRYVVTLRAQDSSGSLSLLVSRSLVF